MIPLTQSLIDLLERQYDRFEHLQRIIVNEQAAIGNNDLTALNASGTEKKILLGKIRANDLSCRDLAEKFQEKLLPPGTTPTLSAVADLLPEDWKQRLLSIGGRLQHRAETIAALQRTSRDMIDHRLDLIGESMSALNIIKADTSSYQPTGKIFRTSEPGHLLSTNV